MLFGETVAAYCDLYGTHTHIYIYINSVRTSQETHYVTTWRLVAKISGGVLQKIVYFS
jgi:hypothetical protein